MFVHMYERPAEVIGPLLHHFPSYLLEMGSLTDPQDKLTNRKSQGTSCLLYFTTFHPEMDSHACVWSCLMFDLRA